MDPDVGFREYQHIQRTTASCQPEHWIYDSRPQTVRGLPPAATPSITIGLIYLIILACFNTPFMMVIIFQFLKGDHPPLRVPEWLIWRIISNIITYFLLSFFYSFVSLAFQVAFSNFPAPDTVFAS